MSLVAAVTTTTKKKKKKKIIENNYFLLSGCRRCRAAALSLSLSIILTDLKKSNKTDIYKDIDWSTDKMTTTGGGVGVGFGASRFMAYSPSPSAPHSPHISGLRSSAASSALVVEQEKYIYIYI